MANHKCQNCGKQLSGPYCQHCGQKEIKPEDKKLKHFFEEFISSLFYADGKFFRTFKLLFTKPGALTQAHIQGARKKYLTPLQVFFFANFLYFIFPLLSTFNTNLSAQMKRLPYSPWVAELVTNHIQTENLEYADFREKYEQKSGQNAKLLLILLVFIQGGIMSLLFIRRKDLFFSDFLSAAAYFTAFFTLVFLIILPGITLLIDDYFSDGIGGMINLNETIISIGIVLTIIGLLFVFIKRAFQIKNFEALWKSVILAFLIIPSFIIYRFILFAITFLMVS